MERVWQVQDGRVQTLLKVERTERRTIALSSTDHALLTSGVKLVIGFQISNVGAIAFERHDLVDDGAGAVLSDLPCRLMPEAVVFVLPFETPATPLLRDPRWRETTAGGYASESDATCAALIPVEIGADSFEQLRCGTVVPIQLAPDNIPVAGPRVARLVEVHAASHHRPVRRTRTA